MPPGREGADNLVQDNDGNARKAHAVSSMGFDDIPGQIKELVNALQGRLFDAVLISQGLSGNPGQEFNIHIPGGILVRLLRGPIHIQDRGFDPEPGYIPVFKPFSKFHRTSKGEQESLLRLSLNIIPLPKPLSSPKLPQ